MPDPRDFLPPPPWEGPPIPRSFQRRRMGRAEKGRTRDEYQRRIAEALRAGDVKKASAIRAEMYRTVGEELHEEDIER